MSTYLETDTTIRGGLPVIASGYVTLAAGPLPVPGEATAVVCPGWDDDVDALHVRFHSGHECRFDMSDADMRRCEGALIDEARSLASVRRGAVSRRWRPEP